MACKIRYTLRAAMDEFVPTKLRQALITGYPSVNTDDKDYN